MELQNKLIEILTNYIQENKELAAKYDQDRTKQSLYEDLLNDLKNNTFETSPIFAKILLSNIYGNDIYIDELNNIMYDPNKKIKLQKFISKIEKDYLELKSQNYQLYLRKSRNYNLVSSAYRTRKCITLGTAILNSKNDIFNIKKIIEYYEVSGTISNKEALLLINEIELYNRKVASKSSSKSEQDYTESLYNELPNIVNMGFQEHDIIEVNKTKRNTLDKFVKNINSLLEQIDKEQIIELVESYQKYNLEQNEYNYIIIKILDTLIEELMVLYTLLLESYNDRKERIRITKEYYSTLQKYEILIKYYNHINEYVSEEEDYEESAKFQNNKRLIYAHSDININRSRLIDDMADVPNEYYESIQGLITRFINGQNSRGEIRKLRSNRKFREYQELRDDQVRIIFKHLKDDIYIILGVFAKKADNDIHMYGRIINRKIQLLDTEEQIKQELELATYVTKELEKTVKEKGRKGTR